MRDATPESPSRMKVRRVSREARFRESWQDVPMHLLGLYPNHRRTPDRPEHPDVRGFMFHQTVLQTFPFSCAAFLHHRYNYTTNIIHLSNVVIISLSFIRCIKLWSEMFRPVKPSFIPSFFFLLQVPVLPGAQKHDRNTTLSFWDLVTSKKKDVQPNGTVRNSVPGRKG